MEPEEEYYYYTGELEDFEEGIREERRQRDMSELFSSGEDAFSDTLEDLC
tara:strand:+ start:437 stop:586 length:150 start_codon:yes stop_codon:yes gene_type:complete